MATTPRNDDDNDDTRHAWKVSLAESEETIFFSSYVLESSSSHVVRCHRHIVVDGGELSIHRKKSKKMKHVCRVLFYKKEKKVNRSPLFCVFIINDKNITQNFSVCFVVSLSLRYLWVYGIHFDISHAERELSFFILLSPRSTGDTSERS